MNTPQTFVVNTTDDIIDANDGVLSLSEAVMMANAANDSKDTILFDESLRGRKIEMSGPLTVTDEVFFDGKQDTLPQDVVTIIKNDELESEGFVFENVEARIENLAFKNGNSLAGTLIKSNNSRIELSNVDLEMGTQYGVSIEIQGGSLSIDNSNIFRGGDSSEAIFSRNAELSIVDSHVDSYGPAIKTVGGSLAIERSTIDASFFYGTTGINTSGILNISNSTIIVAGVDRYGYGNQSTAIFLDDSASANVRSATILGVEPSSALSEQTTGIEIGTGARLILTNSIVSGFDIDASGGNFVDAGNNILGNRDDVGNSDLFATGELADNGGPTPTIALLDSPDNPAIDGADPARAPATDQRGEGRQRAPDIGAFELHNNLPPQAVDVTLTTDQNRAVAGRLVGSDPDGDALTFFTVDAPAHGAVVVDADGDFIYTPEPGFVGTDRFSFKTDDGSETSAKARVTITVVKTPNQPPVAHDQTVSVAEDAVLAGKLTGSDPDGDALRFAKVGDPAHGSLSIDADGDFVYTPARDFDGTDSFTFRVGDGEADSPTATVSVTVVGDGIAEIVVPEIGGAVVGTAGDDVLVGLAGAETLRGLAGNDIIDGGRGADLMDGGLGDDRYTVDDAGDRVIERSQQGFDRINLMVDLDNFQVPAHVEQLVLFDGVIAATPASTGSKLAGLGDDNLFFSGPGTDFYDGNGGRDTLSYANADAGIEASLLKPTAFNTGGAGTDKIDDIEILIGSDFDDVLVGGQGVSNDIDGGRGDDLIVGFAGPDLLTGGTGADTFMYNRIDFRDSLIGDGEDTIVDFERGVDTIDLTRLRVELTDIAITRGRLEVDVTGNGSPDFAINFDNNVLIAATDIVV